MPHLQAANVTFLELRNTVFCVQCELISYNNSSNCLACGSSALLTLNRVLGGSLRNQERTRLVDDELIDRVVENILTRSAVHNAASGIPEHSSAEKATRPEIGICRTLPNALPQLQPAMRWIVDRASTLTRANGAALALARQGKLICHASSGFLTPDLGVEIDLHRGISGLCARSGTSWRCDSADHDPHVDRLRCRELGTQSVLAAPVSHLNSVLGVLEVFSNQKNAFDDHDVATVQLLAGLLVVAITRGARLHSLPDATSLPTVGRIAS